MRLSSSDERCLSGNVMVKRVLQVFFFLITCVLFYGVYILFKPVYFPQLTGPYAVGTVACHLIDEKRQELLYDDPSHPFRELMIQVWYPAQEKKLVKPTKFYDAYLGVVRKRVTWLYHLLMPWCIYTYAISDAPLLQKASKFPVVLFSHGLSGCSVLASTAQCEELASHGYCVVGINHTYDADMVKFSDRLVFANVDKRFEKQDIALYDQEIELWTKDAIFVLDRVEKLAQDADSLFYHRLDLERIGMFGHSCGGATALQACRRDARCKAAINLDGWLFGANYAQELQKPCLSLLAEDTVNAMAAIQPSKGKHSLFEKQLKERYMPAIRQACGNREFGRVEILKGATHLTFMDVALIKHVSPFFRFFNYLDGGVLDGYQATKKINENLRIFFDNYLKHMRE